MGTVQLTHEQRATSQCKMWQHHCITHTMATLKWTQDRAKRTWTESSNERDVPARWYLLVSDSDSLQEWVKPNGKWHKNLLYLDTYERARFIHDNRSPWEYWRCGNKVRKARHRLRLTIFMGHNKYKNTYHAWQFFPRWCWTCGHTHTWTSPCATKSIETFFLGISRGRESMVQKFEQHVSTTRCTLTKIWICDAHAH